MNRIIFEIGPITIYWYSVTMLLAVLTGIYLATKESKKQGMYSFISDLVTYIIVFGIIGARLYYVIFNWSYYSQNPSQILNFRGGGMAIHGALIAGILTGYVFTKIRKINFLKMADAVIIGMPLAQAIGRWGNFINGEAHGGPTNLPWGIMVDGVKVHPTFLYESIWNVGVFVVLWLLRKKKQYEGEIIVWYVGLYSLGRFFIEGLRTDSLMLGPLRMAQVISLVGVVGAIIAHIYLSKKNKESITIEEQK